MAKLITAALMTLLAAYSPAGAGDISVGATPGTINYQGRLERDNSPVTGTVHIYFRVFNSPTAANLGTCGTPPANPCLWQSPEITVQAVQGMFTAAIEPPVSIFSSSADKYLEVEIESETLSPREKINSVVYSYIAKKLEDGASVSVSSLTAAYSVFMATSSGNVGIGTNNPTNKLTVNGSIELMPGGALVFPDGSSMIVASVASAGNISAFDDSTIVYDSNSDGTGQLIISRGALERARMLNNGDFGIGTNAPLGKLDVDGALYVGNEGIYDRDDTALNVKQDLIVEGGRVTGANSEYVAIGETNNVISLVSGAAERMRVHTNGFLGVGLTAPAVMVHSAADIAADAGVRGGRVSIGDYSTWTNLLNEVRSEDGYDLLLQQTNTYNVGVGTNTPREKLHVRGSVRADYGVIASSGYFSGSGITGSNPTLDVRGNFRANTGLGNTVELSSTVIYGSLQVTGLLLGSQGGNPAYLSDDQTFSGKNTFTSLVTASTDVVISPRLGVGMSSFDFGLGAADRYLQVGDNIPAYDSSNANIYIVGGTNADAKLNLYRGGVQAARVETQGANTLGLVTGGTTRAVINPSYFTIQNSPFRVLPDGATPALSISGGGKVGVGVQVTDAAQPLSVNGSIHLLSGSLIFPDGSIMTTSGGTSATAVSSLSDALVQAGLGGSGSVIIKSGATDGILVDNTGRVGVGTTLPLAKLNVRGGDLVVGSPFQGVYATNGVEDLLIGGSLVVDGGIVQRSATPVQFASAIIYGDVYLSTATTGKTGIGTSSPGAKLDVGGDAQFGSGATKSTFTATGALNLRTPLTVPSGGTGATTLTGVIKGNTAAAMSAMTGTGGHNTYWSDANTIASEAQTALSRGGTGADMSSTGGANFFVRQNSAGAAFTASVIADADVPNTITLTNITQITNRSHTNLSDIGTHSHPNIDNHIVATSTHGATSANTVSRIVMRDASGNFSAGTISAALNGNAATVTDGFYTTSSLAGDVTGNPGATVVGNDSHNHTATTISGLSVADFTSANISNWTNDAGYITSAGTAANFSGSLAGDVTGTQGATVVGNDSHTHNGTTISGLAVADFTSANISNWTNDAGYITSAGTAANVSGTVAIGNGGTGATSYTANRVVLTNGTGTAFVSATGGVSGNYTVARTTATTGAPCNQWTITNGVVTAIGGNIACP